MSMLDALLAFNACFFGALVMSNFVHLSSQRSFCIAVIISFLCLLIIYFLLAIVYIIFYIWDKINDKGR